MTVKQFLQTSILFTIVLFALGAAAKPVMDAFAAPENYTVTEQQMAIKGTEIEVLVDNTNQAISQVTRLTADFQGYVIDSQAWYVEGFKHTTLKLGIPANSYEGMLNQLYDLGVRVLKDTSSVQNINSAYGVAQSNQTRVIVLTLVPQFVTPSPTAKSDSSPSTDLQSQWSGENASGMFVGMNRSNQTALLGTMLWMLVALTLSVLIWKIRRSVRLYYL